MALNTAEKKAVAQAFLRCYGEDYYWSGRTLRFISDKAGINLLANVQNEATTWAPFVASGLSIEWWKSELARIFNWTDTT